MKSFQYCYFDNYLPRKLVGVLRHISSNFVLFSCKLYDCIVYEVEES